MIGFVISLIVAYAFAGCLTSFFCYAICNNPEVRRFILDKYPICLLIWPIFMIFIIVFLTKFLLTYIFKSIKEILFITKELFGVSSIFKK
jgi:hypothetical protein